MKIMQKINRQIRVEDDAAEKLLADGWCEVDKTGRILKAADTSEAVKRINALEKQIAELTAAVADANAANAELEKQLADANAANAEKPNPKDK